MRTISKVHDWILNALKVGAEIVIFAVFVVIVVDMQKGGADSGIPYMGGAEERRPRAVKIVDAARRAGIPVIFFQEVHRPSLIDIGRELDGVEDVHCIDGWRSTELADELPVSPYRMSSDRAAVDDEDLARLQRAARTADRAPSARVGVRLEE